MSDPQKPQGKKQTGQGSKDSRLAKRNKNVSADLPDRKKEAQLEADVNREMKEVRETVFAPWQRNVIKLQAQGWSFEKIIEHGEKKRRETGITHVRRIVWPSRKTLYVSLKDRPEFKEECEKAFAFAVDSEAQRTLELAKSLDKVEGLKPPEIVSARDRRIQRTLQVAGRIWPDKWGEQATSEREVIVFEPYGGWVPTNVIKGSPGQGPEAEAARERWKKMREQAKDA